MSSTHLPNIVYLHVHDAGRYIQPYGHAIHTPKLQAFAEQSTLFRHAFCACPTCSPSRGALLTGQSPHSCGQFGLAHRGFELQERDHHLAAFLGKAGYHTVLTGVQHVVRDDFASCGYATVVPTHSKADPARTQGACEWLDAHATDGPFFLDIGFGVTHREFPKEPGAFEDERYTRPPAPLPDTAETRRDMARYNTAARLLDGFMGQVIDKVDELGLADRTIIVCTTDHGIAFPYMKCNLNQHGAGVMLMMRGPGIVPGAITDALTSHVDIFPTLCELVGLEKPAWLEGRSLVPVLAGEADQANEEIFTEVNYHAAYEPMRAVRTSRYSFIKRFHNYPMPVLTNCDDSPSKDVWIEAGWDRAQLPREELYDLTFDPNEACNLIGHPDYVEQLRDMRQRLKAWMERTSDPLLDGAVAPPSGAKVNPMQGRSPREKAEVV